MNGNFIEIHYPKRRCRPKMQNSPAKLRDAGFPGCPVQPGHQAGEAPRPFPALPSVRAALPASTRAPPRTLPARPGAPFSGGVREEPIGGFHRAPAFVSAFSPTPGSGLQTRAALPGDIPQHEGASGLNRQRLDACPGALPSSGTERTPGSLPSPPFRGLLCFSRVTASVRDPLPAWTCPGHSSVITLRPGQKRGDSGGVPVTEAHDSSSQFVLSKWETQDCHLRPSKQRCCLGVVSRHLGVF